jgi:hypothetical protein
MSVANCTELCLSGSLERWYLDFKGCLGISHDRSCLLLLAYAVRSAGFLLEISPSIIFQMSSEVMGRDRSQLHRCHLPMFKRFSKSSPRKIAAEVSLNQNDALFNHPHKQQP